MSIQGELFWRTLSLQTELLIDTAIVLLTGEQFVHEVLRLALLKVTKQVLDLQKSLKTLLVTIEILASVKDTQQL